ncbi:ribbon-helix-helix protein, CopG family [Pseudarthrobacter sp. NIBRBAC000502772]|uniref:ribbon-helix-helix domain-containing protein n=1 Tax=Pseudarthrobacter sp. NIBRBAC000502772 TaxID=2590775 RepID=UPI001130E16B|nr:ribbon-helix-helix domain-containing protein [Pseudarthrobacter sp. NIBRBAC000502772]QDG65801.1 ribbon-helix-helix protein, CopG family [Pseudarthrobacter sp. NIBRBAC000502772]
MSKGTKMRYIRIPDELWDRVKTEAAQQGTNVSDLIRGMLREWLGSKEGEK